MRALGRLVPAGLLVALVVALLPLGWGAGPARAASLVVVTGFGSNPGALDMYLYRPDALPAGAPLVVALHGCTQTAADYHANSGWPKYADAWRFAVVYPQQRLANNSNRCFNWFEVGDTSRGQGEALSIVQMVSHAVASYGLDGRRVYVTGLSAGGAMTAVMLAAYPDRFAGGGVVAGVPYRCATDLSTALSCMSNPPSKTPTQWGDLVRAAHPGYPGPWPRVAIWHGTADTKVVPRNADALRDQWTNVHRIDQTTDGSATLPGNGNGATSRTVHKDATGAVVVQDNRVTGMGHGTPVDPGSGTAQCGTVAANFLSYICSTYQIASFWGLSGGTASPSPSGSTSPSPSASPTASPSPAPACFTANNYEHVSASRAYTLGGYTYADGSNQAMGLYNVYVTHTLKQTGPDYYVLADNGCP